MDRRSIIKSLFTIAVAPKVLAELNLEVPVVANPAPANILVSSLQLLTPAYYKAFVEKYGSENWTLWLSAYGNGPMLNDNKYFWYEKRNAIPDIINTEPCQNTY